MPGKPMVMAKSPRLYPSVLTGMYAGVFSGTLVGLYAAGVPSSLA